MAINIVKGENATVKLRVTERSTGKPYNFEGIEGATASFYAEEGDDPISVTGTNTETNQLSFPLSTSDTELLKAGDSLDFEYRWQQDGELFIERVESQLNVLEQLF